jgi:hypothetical protein
MFVDIVIAGSVALSHLIRLNIVLPGCKQLGNSLYAFRHSDDWLCGLISPGSRV